ncbi:MAG: hypothetical protein C0602_01215 [Denitrovibrio sp.]|nr:MAG: hypothetical protein C0602_01215 [Denitrovibrio sp.]
MIEAILTGMTGRIQRYDRVPYEHSNRDKGQIEEKAPVKSSLDNVSLSKEALELYSTKTVNKPGQSESSTQEKSNNAELTEEQQKKVEELKKRDQEVRAHEQAHLVAGAPYTYGIKYQYEKGPDSNNYAVSGSVQIDTRKEATPERNLEKAQIIKRSAQAPEQPSAQDKKVLQAAHRLEQEARAEMAKQGIEENTNRNQSMGIAQYMKTMAPVSGSTINISY